MEVTQTTTEATLSAIHERLVQLSVTLGRMAARQEHMLLVSKKMTAALTPVATTTPMFVPAQQSTKPSSSSLFSADQVVGAGAPHADAIFASATPTRCSTKRLSHDTDGGHAKLAFSATDTTWLLATTSSGAGNCTLQGVGEQTAPAGCSTHVLTGSAAGACAANIDLHTTSFPRFDGTNTGLWRTQCLEYFTRFNIHKCMWVLAASMHMDGKAKEWYEAYRLRQVVGAWPEFIDDVEAHFGVEDLQPSTTTLGVAHPCSVVHASGDISPEAPTRCSTHVLSWPRDDPGACAWDIEPGMSAEVLTHIGGVSLFQELCADTSDARAKMLLEDVVCDDEVADQVLTHVGSLSLFVEIDMDTHHELEGEIDKPTRLEHGIDGVGQVFLGLPSEEGMLQQLLLNEMQRQGKMNTTPCLPWDPIKQEAAIKGLFKPLAEKCDSHCNSYVVGRSLKEAVQLISDHGLDKIPSWRRCFNSGNSGRPNLGRIPPWRRSAFSPWLGNTMRVSLRLQEATCLSSSPVELLIVRQRLWDPGIVAIYESNLLILLSGQFVPNLVKNAPPDSKQMDFIQWFAQSIQGIVVLLLRALIFVLPNFKDTKLEQVVHGNQRQLVCEWKNTLPSHLGTEGYQTELLLLNSVKQDFGPTSCLSVQVAPVLMIAKWRQWESEHCRCIKKFVNPVLWPIGIFEYVESPSLALICWLQMGMVFNCINSIPKVKVYTSVAIGLGTSAHVQLTEEATYFQSQVGNPLVFLSACRSWHLESMSIEIFDIIWLLQVHAELYMRSGTVTIHHGGLMLWGSDLPEFSYYSRYCQQWMDESSVSKAGCKKFTSLSVLAYVLMVQCRTDIILELHSGHGWRHLEYELYKCSDSCSFSRSGCNVQYKQWNPGVCYFHLKSMSKFSIHKLCNTTKHDGMPWNPGGVQGHSSIAWGQAMFFRAGIVTPGTLGEVGLDVMGHGPGDMGWLCW